MRLAALGLLFAGSFAAALALHLRPAPVPAREAQAQRLPAGPVPAIRPLAQPPSPGLVELPEEEPSTEPRLLLARMTAESAEDVRAEAWALDRAFQLEE